VSFTVPLSFVFFCTIPAQPSPAQPIEPGKI
jgi:hypothetical protein